MRVSRHFTDSREGKVRSCVRLGGGGKKERERERRKWRKREKGNGLRVRDIIIRTTSLRVIIPS